MDVVVGDGLAAAAPKLVVDVGILDDAFRAGVIIFVVGESEDSMEDTCVFAMRGGDSVEGV